MAFVLKKMKKYFFVLLFLIIFVLNFKRKSFDIEDFERFKRKLSNDISTAILIQRQQIVMEMENFEYLRYESKKLHNFTPGTNGTPVRSIIVSTFRRGSTFFGEILNAIPGNFYHYEPLQIYKIRQIRGPPYRTTAISLLKKLLRCNLTDVDDYFETTKKKTFMFRFNTQLWEKCQQLPSICHQPEFLEPFCKLFPHQSMKLVRLRLRVSENLLRDFNLNARIFFFWFAIHAL
jgi:chondroitin 6-sulfotransferase 3